MGTERDGWREPRSDSVRVVYAIQGGGKTSSGSQNGRGWGQNVMYALNDYDIHAVVYAINRAATERTLDLEKKCYAVDARNGVINECVNGTLQCKEQGYNLNSNNVVLETYGP